MPVSRGVLTLAMVGLSGGTPMAHAFQEITVREAPADETVLMSAETVSRASDTDPIIAEGNVRAFFGEQSLTADRVQFDPATDIVVASGNVTVYHSDGQTFFADDVELTGDLRDGIARNFSALLGEQTRLAGSSVVRRSNGRNDVNNGAFTACTVCREDGSTRTPTWQIKALRVTQDTENQMIRFRNAVIEVFGVPVMYTPYFEFPDPSVSRKSGFLTPSIGNSSRSGLEVEIPYYWAISDHQDITFSPRHFSERGTLWQGEYRVRSHDAGAVVQAGIIDPDGVVRRIGSNQISLSDDVSIPLEQQGNVPVRWHFFGEAFKEFDDGWRADIDIDIVSDQTYLRTYNIEPEGELREAEDILQPDRLENELTLSRRTDNTYTEISTVMFQSLRLSEDNDFMADVMPRLRHERRYDIPDVGGEITFSGDLLMLHRPAGLDTTRAIASASYEKSYTTRNGQRFRSFFELRGDVYRYADANLGIQACNVEDSNFDTCRTLLARDAADEEFTTARFLPTAGIEWSLPLARFTDDATIIIEPKVQLVASPERDFTNDIFDEDSQFFQFDTVTLFDWSKSSGFDQWEDGQRLNVGIAASAIYDNGLSISGEIGQQFRVQESLAFSRVDQDGQRTNDIFGLGDRTSDVVGNLNIRFGNNLRMDNRFRIDNEDGSLERGESTISGRVGPFSGNVSYLRVEDPAFGSEGRTDEFLTASAAYRITDRWTIGGNWFENLESGRTTAQSLSLRYRDDCTIFSLAYRFDNTTGDSFNQNRSLTFNVDVIGF